MTYADDAINWGDALNAASWVFVEYCPEKSALLFNNAKPALREAILTYLKRVESTSKQDAFKQERLSSFLAEADEENKRLKEQLERVVEANKQYEQQLFNLRMENARLELAALRWQMFDCEVNRNTADKLLKKLADDAVETYN